MSESTRLADQVRRAFEGDAWHGDSLLAVLADVNASTAAKRPIKAAHSIWELVLHIIAWDDAVLRRTQGNVVKLRDDENFPPVKDTSEPAWRRTVDSAKRTHDELVRAISVFPASRLMEQVPGKTDNYHSFFYMFNGIVQHEIYHTGQIALLKKASQ